MLGAFTVYVFQRCQKALSWSKGLSPLYTGDPLIGTLANRSYPNAMLQNVAFHQSVLFAEIKKSSTTEKSFIFEFLTCDNEVAWVKVQNFKNPELKKFKFLNLQDAYKN